jgi:membrane protein DedA with SNARE-associated domain
MQASAAGWLAQIVITVLTVSGYGGLVGLMALESACIPLPSEVILPFAGYLVSLGRMNLYLVATAGAVGCNVGSAIAYAVGRRGGRRAVERWGEYVLLTERDLRVADWFFHRFGSTAVLMARMLPVVRTFIALPAGISAMPRVRFHLYTFVGSWLWCMLLAWIGLVLGNRWASDPRLHQTFHYIDDAIAALAAVATAHFVWRRIARRKRRER